MRNNKLEKVGRRASSNFFISLNPFLQFCFLIAYGKIGNYLLRELCVALVWNLGENVSNRVINSPVLLLAENSDLYFLLYFAWLWSLVEGDILYLYLQGNVCLPLLNHELLLNLCFLKLNSVLLLLLLFFPLFLLVSGPKVSIK